MTEKRSLASRFFRYTMRPEISRKAPLIMCLGWSVALAAGTTPQAADDTATHVAFVGTLVGGALGFMGLFAGISKWVAEPAARKVMGEHTARGASAHPELMPRPEYDTRHNELMQEISDIKVMVAEMSGRAGGMSRERKS